VSANAKLLAFHNDSRVFTLPHGRGSEKGERAVRERLSSYAVRIDSDLSLPLMAAWAAANLAIGTRYGEQDT